MISLDDRRALVTGGNSGIGAAIVRSLAGAGARVAINYVNHSAEAESLARDIQQPGRTPLTLAADVADPRAVAEMFACLDTAWGGIDILVNNAGIDGRSVREDPGQMDDLQQKIPLGRVGEPDEVARMVAVLVSDIASYVVGCTVLIDGGMTDYPSFAHGG